MKINLLDCTLREAPIKDLILGSDYIQKFINALEKSNIDIIECGFLKDRNLLLGCTPVKCEVHDTEGNYKANLGEKQLLVLKIGFR